MPPSQVRTAAFAELRDEFLRAGCRRAWVIVERRLAGQSQLTGGARELGRQLADGLAPRRDELQPDAGELRIPGVERACRGQPSTHPPQQGVALGESAAV